MFEDWECFARAAAAGRWAHLDWEGAVFHQHGGQRLTDADPSRSLSWGLTMVERVWGRDAGFLAAHGALYAATLDGLRTQLLHERLAAGDSRQARELVDLLGNSAPLVHRALSRLPASGLAAVLGARRRLKRLLAAVRSR